MKLLTICVVILFLFFTNITFAHAQSTYVLPYPSVMPGGISYKLHLVWEKVMQYWYFGDFAQFDYNLKMSDKYLVEAKILFEYNQFLLGYKALQKSNDYFTKIPATLTHAHQHGKDIANEREVLHQASLKHIEVLEKMLQETPAEFTWTPEKTAPSQLALHQLIATTVQIRRDGL